MKPKIVAGLPPVAKKGQMVTMDTEMFGQEKARLHRPEGTFACLSVKLEDDPTIYQIYDQHDVKKVLSAVKNGTWFFHNAVYDLRQLRRFAPITPRFIWDTQLVEKALYGGLYDAFSLQDLTRRYLGVHLEKDVRSEFQSATEMTPDMRTYAALDVVYTEKIGAIQKDAEESVFFETYKCIDEPMIFPILDTPPIKVNVAEWTKMVVEFDRIAHQLEHDLGINSMSAQQVILAAKNYGVHLLNTQHDTLMAFEEVPFIAKVLEARMYRKAVSTYGMNWLESNVEEGDLVYPSFNITGAKTGRESCNHPNLQQVPQRKLPQYRKMFISRYGSMYVSDISQQEPCILAWESHDPVLTEIVNSGGDTHQGVADNLPGAWKGNRDTGKTINLGTSYGLSKYGLSRKLDISEDEAQQLLNGYFSRFRGVFSWMGQKREEAWRVGYVHTASHRRFYINPYHFSWENNAINSPIQGGAADFTKVWQRKMWEMSMAKGFPYTCPGTIHDEVILDPPTEIRVEVKKILDDAFTQTAESLYPGIMFRKETKSGRSWACKKMKEESDDEDTE